MQLQLDNFFFKDTNPLLKDFEKNREELLQTGMDFTKEELVRLFSGEPVEKTYSVKRNSHTFSQPITIEVAKSKSGNMRVWYNDMVLDNFKDDFEMQVADLLKKEAQNKTEIKRGGRSV